MGRVKQGRLTSDRARTRRRAEARVNGEGFVPQPFYGQTRADQVNNAIRRRLRRLAAGQ